MEKEVDQREGGRGKTGEHMLSVSANNLYE